MNLQAKAQAQKATAPMIRPRCVDAQTAADYCGVSKGTFMRHGPKPIKIGVRCVYDLDAVDAWLNEKSGKVAVKNETENAEAMALAAIFG